VAASNVEGSGCVIHARGVPQALLGLAGDIVVSAGGGGTGGTGGAGVRPNSGMALQTPESPISGEAGLYQRRWFGPCQVRL